MAHTSRDEIKHALTDVPDFSHLAVLGLGDYIPQLGMTACLWETVSSLLVPKTRQLSTEEASTKTKTSFGACSVWQRISISS